MRQNIQKNQDQYRENTYSSSEEEQIRKKAYELWQKRGTCGHDLDDWLEAERLVKSSY